ncbi:hypothetical protein GCM10017083_34620 [Thalassobaculum fulvum]|uniref:SHOCT domain-containing protein n=1 Tax=Thalassobaculum fulvum TaxID=1633335 RepID=A0A918XTU9_9PROT|nr:SHOCT domain-containing protein [Thalassobaculum fulvum]GHD55542.1 hypothetical protein GCM10017083_34620 [Thalassobaculum fulvum]
MAVLVRVTLIASSAAIVSTGASAGEWKKVSAEGSPLIFRAAPNVLPGAGFQSKGWDDGYRFRSEYFGNGGSLGSRRLAGIWYYDLSGGRHYPTREDVAEAISRFRIFKERTNSVRSTHRTVAAFGNTDFVLFDSGGVGCMLFSSTFGDGTFHIGTYAGTSRVHGYYCEPTGGRVAQDDAERFIKAIGIRNLRDPIAPEFVPPGSKPADAATAPTTGAVAPGSSAEARLATLKSLLDRGLITKADYEKKKQEILSGL